MDGIKNLLTTITEALKQIATPLAILGLMAIGIGLLIGLTNPQAAKEKGVWWIVGIGIVFSATAIVSALTGGL